MLSSLKLSSVQPPSSEVVLPRKLLIPSSTSFSLILTKYQKMDASQASKNCKPSTSKQIVHKTQLSNTCAYLEDVDGPNPPQFGFGKRYYEPTMESEEECPPVKLQTIDGEYAFRLDENGFFLDEPIPVELEPMEVDGIGNAAAAPVMQSPWPGPIRLTPLVAKRKFGAKKQQEGQSSQVQSNPFNQNQSPPS